MKKNSAMILVLLSLCSAFSVFWGLAAQRSAKGRIADFKLAYYGTKCLLRHCDPYSESEVWNVYTAEGNEIPSDLSQRHLITKSMPSQVYLPSAFLFFAPFALLEWSHAHILWMTLTAAGLTCVAFLIFQVASNRAADISFYLVCFILVNSGVLYAGGNAAGIAVCMGIFAAWSFVQNRYVVLGILCLGASLAIKPHDSGFIWLYFLLAGTTQRKRAFQSLIVLVVLAVPALFWVNHIAPNWIQEVQANLVATSTQGGNADPASSGARLGPGMIIDLQTVFSVFRNDPGFYNTVTYLICGPLLLVWIFAAVRRRGSSTEAWFALAAISALSLVPIYHRPYDAKLLLLTVPACATLWARGGLAGRLGLLLTAGGIVGTSDIPLAVGYLLTKDLHLPMEGMQGKIAAVMLTRSIPLVLLGLGIFYLCACLRGPDRETDTVDSGGITASRTLSTAL
jgi:hypothetical protein